MVLQYLASNLITGDNSDTMPPDAAEGSVFHNTQTTQFWDLKSGTWTVRPGGTGEPLDVGAEYDIYKVSSSLYKALNNTTGLVEFTSEVPDVGALTNDVIADISFLGGRIKYSNDPLLTRTKIVTPSDQTPFQARPFIFEGASDSLGSILGTIIRIDTGFPTDNFAFESISPGGSGHSPNMHFRNLCFYNPYATGSNGVNVTGAGGGTEMIDAGFVNIEGDTNGAAAGCPFSVENVQISYADKGIRAAGYLWFGKLWNVGFNGPSNKFLGSYNLSMENGPNHTDIPKLFNIQKIKTMQNGGLAEGGDPGGSLDYSVAISGAYHDVQDIFIDFGSYNDYVFGIKRCYSSNIYNVKTIDLVAGETGEATCLIDNTSPDGVAAVGARACHNNWIRDCVFQDTGSAPSLKFKNGAWRNEVSMAGHWGGKATIDDAGAGIENIVEILTGHHLPASGLNKITSTNNLVKIIDRRVGSSRRGIRTDSGDASTKVFNIPHGCFATPEDYDARPITADAIGAYELDIDDTNIIVTYPIAPPAQPLKWKWIAEVYA